LSLAILVMALPAQADDLTVGLVACYDLDEEGGARADGWSTNDLTDNNTVGFDAGIINNSAGFSSSNTEWLSIADNPELSLGSNTSFTLAAWIYPTVGGSNKAFIDKGPNVGSQNGHEFRLGRTTVIEFDVGNGSSFQTVSSESTSTNNWYFVVAWHDPDNDTISLQINNSTIYTNTWAGGTQDTSGSLALGRRGDFSGGYWDGRIDQVAYWTDQIIGSDDRTWLYNSGAGRDCQEIADTVPTPTPTETPTPSPTPTGTPVPTITPTPGPKIYEIDLPEGGRAEVVMSMTAGEFSVASILAGVAALLLFAQLVNLAYMNTKR
jgi:hypothetical protein